MTLEKKERALLIKLFYQNGSNSPAALREYRRLKGLRRGPMLTPALRKMVQKFELTGELAVAPGRGRRPIASDVIDEVAVAIVDRSGRSANSAASARAVARELSIPWSTVRKVLRSILHCYPYKIRVVQELKAQDPQQRIDFAQRFLARMVIDASWPWNILWTDEAHFNVTGAVNTQNCRIWGSSHPHSVHEQPLHSDYVTVWCGFTADFMLGPFFFEELTPQGPVRSTVTSARYSQLLRQHVVPALQERGCLETTVFMQDGATPHTVRQSKELLMAHFGEDRVISRGFSNAWPARSPDVNPCDFWLWGYLKDRVYQGGVQSVHQLKANITMHVTAIPPEMLRATVDHAILRFQHVIDANGSHIER